MNINMLMQQAKKMQNDMEKAKEEVSKKTFTAKQPLVEVEVNGDTEITKISISKDIEKEDNIILAFGRAEEYKNIDITMFLGNRIGVKPVVIAQPYYKGQPIIKKYEEESKITHSKLYVDVPFDFPFYIMNHYNKNMILLIPSKKEIFGLIVNQVRKLNKNNILIVANDIGGLHEQIQDKKDGLLVDLDKLEESAKKISKHFNSKTIKEFNKESQLKLSDIYDFEKICTQFLDFFFTINKKRR